MERAKTTMGRAFVLSAGAVAALALAGCAYTPPPEVVKARVNYDRAAANPRVTQFAAVELHEADGALRQLESSARAGKDESVSHLARIANRRVEIAELAAQAGANEAQVADLTKQRDALQLRARTTRAVSAEARAERGEAEVASARVTAREAQLATERAHLATDLAQQSASTEAVRAAKLSAELEDLKAEQTERGLVFTLSDVLFATGKSVLQPGAERTLGKIAAYLIRYPDRQVTVEGHTDSVGDDAYNLQLSRDRADAVALLLETHGVDRARVKVRGLGEATPVAPNETNAGRQANRRVEIVVDEKG